MAGPKKYSSFEFYSSPTSTTFSFYFFYFEEHIASSFSSDHYLHRNFLRKINLLCMHYDVGNRLENERESDEEPNSSYGYL